MNGPRRFAGKFRRVIQWPKSANGVTSHRNSQSILGSEGTRTFLRDTRAREAQADKYFQEIIEIADAATSETVNVARLRIDSRKFTVARLAPKKYGDHISHDVKGAGSSNFQPQILIQCSSAGDDEGYIDISAASEAAGGLPQQGNGNSLPGTGGRR